MIANILPTDQECEQWFTENIEEGCSASSGIYKFRLWLNDRLSLLTSASVETGLAIDDQGGSKVVAYPNGDLLNIDTCREALGAYWCLSEAERRAFERLRMRSDLREDYLKLKAAGDL